MLVLFTILFGALFVGIAYAFHFHGAFVERDRFSGLHKPRCPVRLVREPNRPAAVQRRLIHHGTPTSDFQETR